MTTPCGYCNIKQIASMAYHGLVGQRPSRWLHKLTGEWGAQGSNHAIESVSFRKTLRRIFHASSRSDQSVSAGLNPISSEPIGEGGGVAMSAIETSLAALKEASSLAGKIPYISPVAGLLLQVLTMRDEVKQHKEEWDIVMRKLGRVASLVVNVGESCQKYNLEEKDLPPGLRSILQSIQSELRGIESALRRNTEVGRVEKVLLRKDLLRKVKQYDGELSNILQTFQVGPSFILPVTHPTHWHQAELVLDVRFALVEARQVLHAGPSGVLISSRRHIFSKPQEPSAPAIFFGRDAELAEILHMIFTGVGSRPARIAILGHGGYGKTTLASAVSLTLKFKNTSGMLDTLLLANQSPHQDNIICLDNFESPWDQAGDIRHSVEKLLSRIAGIHCVTLLITMREELIKAVDYVPLAVTLLAHLSQATSPSILLKEWHLKQTKFIQMGQGHKLSNLEYSIQLSIESGSMKANPSAKDLLGILSMLPDGIHTKQLEIFQEILVDMDLLSCLRILQQCSLINVIGEKYQTHPITRHFCNHQNFISENHIKSLQEFYINLASSESYRAQAQKHAEMALEVNNTKAMLFHLLKSNYMDHSRLVDSIITFTLFHVSIGDHSDRLISQTVEYLQKRQGTTSLLIKCLQRWGKLCFYASDTAQAKHKMQEAEMLCSSSSDKDGALHAAVLTDLSELYLWHGALDEAEASYQKALKLHQIANDAWGQGNDHKGLGDIYLEKRKPAEAEASYKKALEFHKIANSALRQGNDYKGLGETYLQLEKPDELNPHLKWP
ncbi:hypothetical protein B0F90DRAFT_1670590 [Multifurca ochricompacta]|uniref:Uncharacterized protein n=1 Tax=Multifurca ochricompacta TaxID=376703 RepID=A0AAD4LZ68_9AGAM|nr:hypothetical protein B0F90DRAFT_1670590 [Multifurca ochricompacta]